MHRFITKLSKYQWALAYSGIVAISLFSVLAVPQCVLAMTGSIVPDSKYAWGENIGWMNFAATGGNVEVTDTALTGYVWTNNYGWINLGPFTNYAGVTNTASGQLGGYAWSSTLGWIPMTGASIDTSTGIFHGIAGDSGSTAARITFDCSKCRVTTTWRSANTGIKKPATTATTAPPATAVAVTPQPAKPSDAKAGNPSQLFDIRLSIDEQRVKRISDLIATVSFTSFGSVDTPVSMTFSIVDSHNRVIWTGKDSTTVQTESLFTKKFTSLKDQPPGRYTLKLRTVYNGDVTDDFTASFSIVTTPWWQNRFMWLLALLPVLLLPSFIIWKRHHRKR